MTLVKVMCPICYDVNLEYSWSSWDLISVLVSLYIIADVEASLGLEWYGLPFLTTQ